MRAGRVAVVGLAVLAGLALAGCGSDTKVGAGDAAGNQAVATTTTEPGVIEKGGNTAANVPSDASGGASGAGATTGQQGVQGKITDSAGQGLFLVTISVKPTGATQATPGASSQEANVSAEDGTYFLPLPPGTYEVTFALPEFTSTIKAVTVGSGTITLNVVLTK